jgi:adenine-specific DNA-methyltransferase
MSELLFKGKEFVFNHHLSVPYRPLEAHADKGIAAKAEAPKLDGNLVIHGDNLHALKALMPMYAGKVDCIFIDPPYNTGNEGWAYSDNVNSPYINEWLSSNPINKEDLLRHDKWLCMMWPRLRLLHELLADTGSFWMTLDDNEIHRARLMCDEIFGEENFVGCALWQKKYAPSNDTVDLSAMHDYVLCYAKRREFNEQGKAIAVLNKNERTEEQNKLFKNPDADARGEWASGDYTCNKSADQREKLYYPLEHPETGEEVWPSKTAVWRFSKARHLKNVEEGRVWWGKDNENPTPRYKRFLTDVGGVVQGTWWPHTEVGHNDEAKKEIKQIFSEITNPFDTPKPVELLKRILQLATDDNSIVLDSFAGSGTTAHAVLALNAEDEGDRKFILVEGEDYADTLTAERVRRVMNGYKFTGKQRTQLLREPINFTALKKASKLLDKIAAIENLHGHEFDCIKKTVKDDTLVVTGERDIEEKTTGLGGTFTYCTLGEAVDLQALLSGKDKNGNPYLPTFEQFGAWAFSTATSQAFSPSTADASKFYLGESAAFHVWLYYKPDLDWLKSKDSALTLEKAEALHAAMPLVGTGKRHLVYAPAKFVPNRALQPLAVEYAPLPFALFKIER